MTRSYRLTHRTTYRYDDDVTASFGRAHLLPREGPGQTVVEATITVDPAPDELRDHTDAFGKRSTYLCVRTPHRQLTVLATSLVTVADVPLPAPEPPWDAVRNGLHGSLSTERLDAIGYTLPSPRLAPHPDVAAYALPSFRPGRPLHEAALDLSRASTATSATCPAPRRSAAPCRSCSSAVRGSARTSRA